MLLIANTLCIYIYEYPTESLTILVPQNVKNGKLYIPENVDRGILKLSLTVKRSVGDYATDPRGLLCQASSDRSCHNLLHGYRE